MLKCCKITVNEFKLNIFFSTLVHQQLCPSCRSCQFQQPHLAEQHSAQSSCRLTYLFMIWTNGVGASTGMFVPALAIGATGGRIFGRLVTAAVRCAPLRTWGSWNSGCGGASPAYRWPHLWRPKAKTTGRDTPEVTPRSCSRTAGVCLAHGKCLRWQLI